MSILIRVVFSRPLFWENIFMKKFIGWGVGCALALSLSQAAYSEDCGRAGQEMCLSGQTYRCEQTGGVLTPIFQNRPCVVNGTSLAGVWRGTGHQTPAGSAGADWSIVMTIQDQGGLIEYPSLSCGGQLSQVSRDDTSAQYRETITFGGNVCINGGLITVRLVNGSLAWTWQGAAGGKNYNAIAVLTR
jgi:hypothetical protein